MNARLADFRDTLLVALACVFAGVLVLGAPLLGLPLCALALSWLTYRRGPMLASAVAIGASILLAVLSLPTGILLAPVLLIAGPYAAGALKRRPPWEVVLVVSGAALMASIGAVMLDAAVAHQNVTTMVQQSMLTWMGVSGKNVPAGTDIAQLTQLAKEAAQQWPGMMTIMAILGGLASVYAVGLSATRAGLEDMRMLPPLAELDLSFHLTWAAIAGLALMALGRFLGQPDGAAAVVGVNIMRVAGVLFALQGVAVFAHWYRKAGLGRFGRGIGYAFLLFTELVTAVLIPMGLVGLTGLVDLWVNFRKLPRKGFVAEPRDRF